MYYITHGITGNKYVLSPSKELLEWICGQINKSPSAIRFHEKYRCYVIRIKSKHHKKQLQGFIENEKQDRKQH